MSEDKPEDKAEGKAEDKAETQAENQAGNKKWAESERAYIELLVQEIKDVKIQSRFKNSIAWYSKRAVYSKRWFYLLTVASIFAGAIIPIINLYPGDGTKVIVSVISAVGAVSLSICNLFTFKDSWLRYRKYSELLKSECFKYVTKTGIYKDKDKADEMFVKRMENINAIENEEWYKSKEQTIKQDTTKPDGAKGHEDNSDDTTDET